MRRRRLTIAVALVAATAGAAGAVTALARLGVTSDQTSASSASLARANSHRFDAAQLYKVAAPGAVTISGTIDGRTASGSGFVADREGHIVTNAHVVTDSPDHHPDDVKPGRDFYVRFASGNSLPATLTGYDLHSDIAVLQVDPALEELHPLAFAPTAQLQVGDPVAVIGSPLGVGQGQSLSTGVVGSLDQVMRVPAADDLVQHVIQTDAAINHGNSGAPLLNSVGRVVGVVSQILTEPGSGTWRGVGLALPADAARASVARITGAPASTGSPS